MTPQRIDDALADWNRRLEAMAANLLWLQAESTYQTLTGPAKVKLAGETERRVQPALAALPSLFENFDLLNSAIARADSARKALSTIFPSEQKIAEIEHLLFGRSIKLPIVEVPVDQRTLLGQSQSNPCVSPEELLAPMAGIFAAARDAILTVERAWEQVASEMAATESRVDQLRRVVGVRSLPLLDRARQLLAELREQAQADPLGTLDALHRRVQPALTQAQQEAEAIAQARREMEAARGLCDGLAQLHRDAVAAADEARRKIADCAHLPAPFEERRIAYLREWLERVERLLRDEAHDSFAVELRNWKASAEDCARKAREVAAANRAPVDARRELCGRLDALKAKARSRGVAEKDGIVALARHAETLLAARPTDLAQAAQAVAEYAKTLQGGERI